MCGIYGYIGQQGVKKVFEGLQRLEYRGYDSAGVAFVSKCFETKKDYSENIKAFNNGLVTIKAKGELKELEKLLKATSPQSDIAIGHTRWATHGKPSALNSHPHTSPDGNFAVVHNGIVENYAELKLQLDKSKFVSETDTEVVAHLLEKFYEGDTLKCLQKVCGLLQGSFALAVINSKKPECIYVARRTSPVAVGVGEGYGVVCSDLGGMEKVEKAYIIENDNFAVLEPGKVSIYNEKLEKVQLRDVASLQTFQDNSLGDYPHYMLKEIEEAPYAIERTVLQYDCCKKISAAMPQDLRIDNVLIVACGTAYHAGLMGKNWLEKVGIKTEVEIASEFRYGTYITRPNTLAIFVSQSGETADTIKAVKLCKSMGLKTLALTNVKNSSITFETDYVLYTQAGAEISVASTKAYDCQLALLYLLAAYFKEQKGEMGSVNKAAARLITCVDIMKNLEVKEKCCTLATEISPSESLYMIGRGLDYALALEASLKLKEVSYIHCEAYAAGELKHGTISLIDKNTFVFAFATQQHVLEKTLSNVSEVASRDGKVVVFTQYPLQNKEVYKIVKLPAFDDDLMPFIAVHYMQLIAYFASTALGHNPDKPRSLAKSVTVE